MRVAIQPTSGPPVWLAGDPTMDEREFSSAADIVVSGDIQVQTDAFVRARSSILRDRGNLVETLAFSTSRKFPSHQDACLWVLLYMAGTARSGYAIFEIPTAGGTVTRCYMPHAVVMPPERRIIGVSVLLNYQIRGSAITNTIPS